MQRRLSLAILGLILASACLGDPTRPEAGPATQPTTGPIGLVELTFDGQASAITLRRTATGLTWGH